MRLPKYDLDMLVTFCTPEEQAKESEKQQLLCDIFVKICDSLTFAEADIAQLVGC